MNATEMFQDVIKDYDVTNIRKSSYIVGEKSFNKIADLYTKTQLYIALTNYMENKNENSGKVIEALINDEHYFFFNQENERNAKIAGDTLNNMGLQSNHGFVATAQNGVKIMTKNRFIEMIEFLKKVYSIFNSTGDVDSVNKHFGLIANKYSEIIKIAKKTIEKEN